MTKAELIKQKMTAENELQKLKKDKIVAGFFVGVGWTMIFSFFFIWSLWVSVAGIVVAIFAARKRADIVDAIKANQEIIVDLTVELAT